MNSLFEQAVLRSEFLPQTSRNRKTPYYWQLTGRTLRISLIYQVRVRHSGEKLTAFSSIAILSKITLIVGCQPIDAGIAVVEEPKDLWGSDYIYRNPGLKNLGGYDLHSAGPDRPR